MKKIIKLKNTSIKIDTTFKDQLASLKETSQSNSNVQEDFKAEEMQNYL